MEATLPAVAEELLKEIKKAFQETSHVPDDLLLALKFVFGSSAVAALDLVDQHSVTRIVSPSGRAVYQESFPTWDPQQSLAACLVTSTSSRSPAMQVEYVLLSLRSSGVQANCTPATPPATSARALHLLSPCCGRTTAWCVSTSLPCTSARPQAHAKSSLSLTSSWQASYWQRKRRKDLGPCANTFSPATPPWLL